MYAMIVLFSMIASLISPQVYTIDSPRIIVHSDDHLVQIKWFQHNTQRITVMKLTQSHHYNTHCTDVDWSQYLRMAYGKKYCFDIFQQWVSPGYITVTDKKYERGDIYFILEYRYTSHNAPYGPFR